MEKVFREGINIEVAARSSMKRLGVGNEIIIQRNDVFFNANQHSELRNLLLSIARKIYYSIKPLLRPLFSRLRNYFLAPLIAQLAELEQKNVELKQISDQSDMRLRHIEYLLYTSKRIALNCSTEIVFLRCETGYVLCPSSDYRFVARLMESGDFEPGTREVIVKVLTQGCVFIDIGAHIGLHSLGAARALEGKLKIIAFEPYAPTFHLLSENMHINQYSYCIEMHKAAITKRTEKTTLFLGKSSATHSLLSVSPHLSHPDEKIDVSGYKLDDIVKDDRIALIKISVEGCEFDVIDGAKALINKNPNVALIVKFRPSLTKNHERTAWLNRFHALGFKYKQIDEHTRRLKNVANDLLNESDVNYFFAREDSVAWIKVRELISTSKH